MRVERTTSIPESDEVMAMFADPMVSYRTKWQDVNIVKVGIDERIPSYIRESLVGLTIPTIFSKEKLESQGVELLTIPTNSRFAYVDDVINVLKTAGKFYAAKKLKENRKSYLDMYLVEGGIYDLIQKNECMELEY